MEAVVGGLRMVSSGGLAFVGDVFDRVLRLVGDKERFRGCGSGCDAVTDDGSGSGLAFTDSGIGSSGVVGTTGSKAEERDLCRTGTAAAVGRE